MALSIESRVFGSLPNGESVEAWTLHGKGGLIVEAMTYGGIVTRLLAPDRNGNLADVVLGFNTLNGYLGKHPYFGAIVGRVAGRIPEAVFHLNGSAYRLSKNEGPNHLHGGVRGFDKKLWKAQPQLRQDGAPSVRLTVDSLNGEEGYPGYVQTSVTYTVTDDDVFLIEVEAVTDRPTPFSLTQHSYFNLAGEASGTILNHVLQIYADDLVPTNECMRLLGRLESVSGYDDFRLPRRLDATVPELFRRHGALYRVRKSRTSVGNLVLVPAAKLTHLESGRVLEVFTTEPYLQFYTGASLDGSITGKSGTRYVQHAGLCLECEGYPDAMNTPSIGNILLRPGERHCSATAYAFSRVRMDGNSTSHRLQVCDLPLRG